MKFNNYLFKIKPKFPLNLVFVQKYVSINIELSIHPGTIE